MRLSLRLVVTAFVSSLLAAGYYSLLVRPEIDSLHLQLAGRQIELLSPRWLGLLCGLPLLWLLAGRSLVDMSRLQQVLAMGVRGLMVAALAIALARPAITTTEDRVSTVFVVDVSRSVSDDQVEQARQIVQRAWRARGDNDVHLITFAQRAEVVPLDPSKARIPPLARHRDTGASDHSDLQAAIQHAYGLFPANRIPRIVLISDGNETDGDVLAEAYRASSRDVRIHVQPLTERRDKEVLVRGLELPQEVRMGAPFSVKATVYSTHEEKGVRFTLYKDEMINGLEGFKKVDLHPGGNTVTFKSMVREPGFVNYRMTMSGVHHDTWKANNRATAILPVLGRPRVLYVEGEPLYAGYLKRALEAERIDVVTRGPYGIPGKVAQLAKFDLVIISDVPAMYIGLGQMMALQAYVRDLGGGFLMAGGQNSFGAGGYYGTRIEKILPVRFDTEKKRSQPSLALALCIDRSGSMSGPKIELAKEAARATTELLGSSDLIAVLAFDNNVHTVVRLQRAANRLRILNDIAQLRPGGGTNILPCLREANTQLHSATAKVKHVILLSDGQSSYNGIHQLVDEMASHHITVSAVGVGPGADRTLLQMIAERGNGRFYHTNDATNVPKIFTKETTKVARSALVEEPVQVHVVKRANVVKGIDFSRAPRLRGYVSTKAKPLAETILVSNYGEPILAMWRLGLGKTAAFTSDVKNRWGAEWLRWSGYSKFFAQLVRELMRHRIQRSFEMTARARHGQVHVVVDALDRSDRFINGLDSTLSVIDPEHPGRKKKLPLHQTAAGRYEARFRLPRYGSFLLRARHELRDKVTAQSITSISVPYPQEYIDLVPDAKRLARVAAVSNGRVRPKPAEVFSADGDVVRFHKDLWPWMLYLAIGLFILDVLLRRVRIFGYAPEPM